MKQSRNFNYLCAALALLLVLLTFMPYWSVTVVTETEVIPEVTEEVVEEDVAEEATEETAEEVVEEEVAEEVVEETAEEATEEVEPVIVMEEKVYEASIQGVLWFPAHNLEIQEEFAKVYPAEELDPKEVAKAEKEGTVLEPDVYSINSFVGTPLLVMFFAVLAIVLCFVKPDSYLVALAPAACGAYGVWAFNSHFALRIGMATQSLLFIIVCGAMFAVSMMVLLLGLKARMERE